MKKLSENDRREICIDESHGIIGAVVLFAWILILTSDEFQHAIDFVVSKILTFI